MNEADAILREPLRLASSILEFYSGMASCGIQEITGNRSPHDCESSSGGRGRSARVATRNEDCNFHFGE